MDALTAGLASQFYDSSFTLQDLSTTTIIEGDNLYLNQTNAMAATGFSQPTNSVVTGEISDGDTVKQAIQKLESQLSMVLCQQVH